MWIAQRVLPVAMSLAMVFIATTMLWFLKLAAGGLPHPVFLYLPLVALVAIRYGSLPALLCASAATACAAFFFYDPVYSFTVHNRLAVGDLLWFAVLASIGVKCAGLLRPLAKAPAPTIYLPLRASGGRRGTARPYPVGETTRLEL